MNVLIIGLGSIAKKHILALKTINKNVHIYALRSGQSLTQQIDGVTNIEKISTCPPVDFIIISNPTAFHADAIKQVSYLKKPLFIEKPPFHTLAQADECLAFVNQNNIPTYTAFNLRFLDCLIYLKENIDNNKVQEVNVYCGSYLPNWRSNVDYKKSYSANADMGGGVHLDLIHELDYVLWIFGNPLKVQSTLRSNSTININAIDYANYILIYDHFVVNIILNYYRKETKRSCEIVFDDTVWHTNLITNEIMDMNNKSIFKSTQTVQDTYLSQMEYFCEAVKKNEFTFNSIHESINTLKIALK
ncbi:MAG: Gfo/Idh/MocA family oxidoreductase [Bacteroidia bacterium]